MKHEFKGLEAYAEFHQEAERVNNLVRQLTEKLVKKANEELETIVRDFSSPPIKGEITKGKLKWRGIKLEVYQDLGKTTYRITQRGEQIGYDVNIATNFNVPI